MGLKDIFSIQGGLDKLKITAFEDDTYKNATATYVVMYNPTSFKQNFKSKWIKEEGASTKRKKVQFRGNLSDRVSFEFLFDATEASPSSNGNSVDLDVDIVDIVENLIGIDKTNAIELIEEDQHVDGAIKKFLDVTNNIKSETHTPNYLQINWGDFEFRGVLESANINYKLFNSAGLPIRATITATFVQSLSRKEQSADAKEESTDVTHKRKVNSGDTLPLIAKRIYGDSKYYMQIAKVNKLKNFRDLKMGQELILPPLEK